MKSHENTFNTTGVNSGGIEDDIVWTHEMPMITEALVSELHAESFGGKDEYV